MPPKSPITSLKKSVNQLRAIQNVKKQPAVNMAKVNIAASALKKTKKE